LRIEGDVDRGLRASIYASKTSQCLPRDLAVDNLQIIDVGLDTKRESSVSQDASVSLLLIVEFD